MAQDLGVHGVAGHLVQSPVVVEPKFADGLALDQGALVSPSKPGAAVQMLVWPETPGDSGDHGVHVQ